MKYIRANSLKRLFSLKRRSFEEGAVDNSRGVFEEEDKDGVLISSAAQRPSWKCFSFEEIFVATNGFSSENLVGKGGYAEVYRGVLNNGEEIAVKRLTKTYSDERKEKDFLTEIGTIGHVCHPNVLRLIGCCIDNGLFLIFRFSSLGSVASRLHDANSPPMDWKTRYKIAIGTAKGLHYLHKVCQRRIIHRDIKSSNILLTADFEPQISDFGLAKWLPSQWTHHSIAPIEGTFGHLAPEYFMHGTVDEKTDVFAFGVCLLEIISGRKPVDASHQSLHCWAKPLLNREEMDKLVDPRLRGSFDSSQLKRLMFTASLCIRTSSAWRPTMTEVLGVLMEGETDKEKWKMPEEEGQEELWGFEDLEYECHSFSVSPVDSISTAGSLRERN
ncbi:Receptor-like cytosolic serine/threonine-protein kinase RBK2 [Hibiscus syriacus]|uniref:Receptor-like cytosolic serine/threonine-protein kinase RBK2 n=1 Tax=Hibiscus syriacus TaxID=106335 RepID=A0A6A2Y325_HIBSY|nr:probable receptor-like serine/threonine-protein kinase At5g57670 [Hibiscus syriacus]KAE8674985.1 Receptor-like cytosolic serine/threonine-protein kinase RBK2 [Hibiscus syriacus]